MIVAASPFFMAKYGFTRMFSYAIEHYGYVCPDKRYRNPVKGVKLAPNYQGWIFADGSGMSHSPYLSLEIKF